MTLVIDASIALAWCFEDEATPATEALADEVRDHGAYVPALWHLEVGNVLLLAERRGRLSIGQVALRLELTAELPIVTDYDGVNRAWHEVLSLARHETLTLYDATYLELAVRLDATLATLDSSLAAAAARLGVSVRP